MAELEGLCPDFARDGDIVSDNPVRGALVKKSYTAIAHFMLIAETLPADSKLNHPRPQLAVQRRSIKEQPVTAAQF